MKSIHKAEFIAEIESRLHFLNSNSQRRWGTMTPAEMLAHLSAQLRIVVGDIKAKNEYPTWTHGIVKKVVLHLPWLPNLPTPKPMRKGESASFTVEKDSFQMWLSKFISLPKNTAYPHHPFLGKLSHEEWGQMVYKHIDHHFRQFGA